MRNHTECTGYLSREERERGGGGGGGGGVSQRSKDYSRL